MLTRERKQEVNLFLILSRHRKTSFETVSLLVEARSYLYSAQRNKKQK